MAADRALGQAMAQQQLGSSMPWMGRQVIEYVNRLGQNLTRGSGAQQETTFLILYSHELNAQTFPGGIVIVNSAVITTAESEAELAAVLAHEIAHVNNCDWRWQRRKRNAAILLPAVPLVMFAGPVGIAAGLGGAVSARLAQARSNRAVEQEADRLAIKYLIRAGYDPHAALRMFERMEAQGAGQGPGNQGLLATHPNIGARRQRMESLLADLTATPSGKDDSAEFQEVRNEILRYDEVYARVLGLRPPGEDAPKLQRRPLER
jgi:predicted Zn-dependent protease